ncbi:MAG: hypothetical protein NC177_00655 [Ruminococcus flavefaciens]|nr:hypothetical protein [Ruminococcus flavefaciens]
MMINIKKILFIVIAGISLVGCSYTKKDNVALPYSDGIKLTLDDVVNLSEKGSNLKWSDFDGYSYYETGCGLYIRVYEINEKFSMCIGGAGTYNDGLVAGYFHLESDSGNFTDIRNGNIKDFIAENS